MKILAREKAFLYELLGLKFEGNVHDYKSIIDSISFGALTKEVLANLCNNLEEGELALKHYALHQLQQRAINQISNHLDFIDNFIDEPIGEDICFGDIITDVFFKDQQDLLEIVGDKIAKNFDGYPKIRDDIGMLFENMGISNNSNYTYLKRTGAIASLYFLAAKRYKVQLKNASRNSDSLYLVPQNTFDFIKLLMEFNEEYDLTEDFLVFERQSNLILCLNAYLIINMGYRGAADGDLFKIVSSISIIDNLELKMNILEKLNEDRLEKELLEYGLISSLFQLKFVLLPLLVDFLEGEIGGKLSSRGKLLPKNKDSVIDKEQLRTFKVVKKNSLLFCILNKDDYSLRQKLVNDFQLLLKDVEHNRNIESFNTLQNKMKDLRMKLLKEEVVLEEQVASDMSYLLKADPEILQRYGLEPFVIKSVNAFRDNFLNLESRRKGEESTIDTNFFARTFSKRPFKDTFWDRNM